MTSRVQKYFYLVAITLYSFSIIIALHTPHYTIQAFQYELINTFGEWDVAQNDSNHLNQPYLLSVDRQYIIVNDDGNNRIVIFNRSTLGLLYTFNEYSFDNGTKLKISHAVSAAIFNDKVVLYDYGYQTLFILELNGTINKMFYWPTENDDKTYLVAYIAPVSNSYLYLYTNSNDTLATYWNITVFDNTLTKLSSVALTSLIPELKQLSYPLLYSVQNLENETIFVYIHSDPAISCVLSYDPVNSQWNVNTYELKIHPLSPLFYSNYLNVFYYISSRVYLYTSSGELIGCIEALPNSKYLTGATLVYTYKDILYTTDYEHHVLLAIKITDLTPNTSTTITTTDTNSNTFMLYLIYLILRKPFITFSVLFLLLVLIGSLIALKIKKKHQKIRELEP